MTGHSAKHQILGAPRRLTGRLTHKKVFLIVSMLIFGILIVRFGSTSVVLRNESIFTLEHESAVSVIEATQLSTETESTLTDLQPSFNETKENVSAPRQGLAGLSEHMRQQVEFLRDAIEGAHHEDLPLAKDPNCTGDRMKGEVEDMLCLPRPDFIKDVKNPCWWEPPGTNKTLHCIPSFHILGCEKCGSSDLWNRITSHPEVLRISGIHDKEANWWAWERYGIFHYRTLKNATTLTSGYTQRFLELTQKVEHSLRNGGDSHRHLITGDGTPSDMMDFRGWVNITQNRWRKLPHVLTPHLMKHIYPETTKFIVILREPIERLYSDFCYATLGKSAEDFHSNILGAIDTMSDCIRQRSVRECFFDFRMYRRGVVRLHLILYTIYLTEWLKVIPRERFLFLKTEEYQQDIYGTLKKCFQFLGVGHVKDKYVRHIANQPRFLEGSIKKSAGPMWRSTKEIIEEIVRPSMHFLPELLEDDRFMWNFNSTPVAER